MNQTFGPDRTDPSNGIFMPRRACPGPAYVSGQLRTPRSAPCFRRRPHQELGNGDRVPRAHRAWTAAPAWPRLIRPVPAPARDQSSRAQRRTPTLANGRKHSSVTLTIELGSGFRNVTIGMARRTTVAERKRSRGPRPYDGRASVGPRRLTMGVSSGDRSLRRSGRPRPFWARCRRTPGNDQRTD